MSLFWIPCGAWFLFFAYALLGKKRDAVLLLAFLVAAVGVGVMVFTDNVIMGYRRFFWGTAQNLHPTFHPLISFGTAAAGAYGVLLILKKRRVSETATERKSLGLLIYGALFVMSVIVVLNVFIPAMIIGASTPRFGSSAFAVLIILVFIAITKHRFMSISLERVAEELFEDIQDGILLVDHHGRINRANPAAELLLGDNLIGKGVRKLFSDHDIKGNFYDRIIPLERSGDTRYIALSSSTTARDGEVLGKILIVRDITEQKEAEAVLKRSKEAAEAAVAERTRLLKQAQKLESLGTLAESVAHDFNNLLSVILGFARAAKTDAPPDHRIIADLDEIIVAGTRGKEIVRQISTVGRRQDDSDCAPEDLGELVQETLLLFRVSVPKHISVEVALTDETVLVRCDAVKLGQVIMSLCNNAVYAMKRVPKGRLEVGIERLTVTEELSSELYFMKPGPAVRLYVSDTGCGIDDADLSRVFNPFFTTKPKREGTGLGLAFSFAIVRDLEGDILVESEPGKGTTFSIYLPVLEGEVDHGRDIGERISDVAPLVYQGGEIVLLVDDDPQIRRAGRRLLEQLGYRVLTASSGAEALRKIGSKEPRCDLVLADFAMAGMNGMDLARALKEEGVSVPVVMMSGYRKNATPDEIRDAGIVAFLEKPVSKTMLAKTVRSVLDMAGAVEAAEA
jgi:PAS domain S-box-containing protein